MGNNYMGLVNRVMQMMDQGSPWGQMAQSANNMQAQGIDPLSSQGLRDPQMRNAMMDMVMAGSVKAPEEVGRITPEMLDKILKRSNTYKPRIKNTDVWNDEEGKAILERAIRVITGRYK